MTLLQIDPEELRIDLARRERSSGLLSRTAGSVRSPTGAAIDVPDADEARRADFTRRILQQESGGVDPGKANYANAWGPMQITEKTFSGMKALGQIPADWDIANPEHSARAAEVHIAELWRQYGGDERKVAAAYYSGPKAINKDGTIRDLRDPVNPKAPSTLKYVEMVGAREQPQMLQWSAVAADERFKKLPSDQQEAVRAQYFSDVLAPQLPPERIAEARARFDEATAPSAWRDAKRAMSRWIGESPNDVADLTPEQYEALAPDLRRSYDAAKAQQRADAMSRSWTEAVLDFGLGMGKSLASIAELPALGYALTAPELAQPRAPMEALGAVQKKLSSWQSEKQRAVDAAVSETIKAPEGVFDTIGAAFAAYTRNPAALASVASSTVPLLITGTWASKVTEKALLQLGRTASMAFGAKALASNSVAAARAAQAVSAVTKSTAPSAGAVLTFAVAQGGDAARNTFERAMEFTPQQWMNEPEYATLVAQGVPHEEAATRVAEKKAGVVGALSFASSLASMAVPGGRALETAFLKRASTLTRAQSVVRATAGEPIQEGIEEGSAALFGAQALQQLDPNINPAREALGAGLQAAIPAAGMGAMAGGLQRSQGPAGAPPGAPLEAEDVLGAPLDDMAAKLKETASALRLGGPVQQAQWEVVGGQALGGPPPAGPAAPGGPPPGALPPPGQPTIIADARGNAMVQPAEMAAEAQTRVAEAAAAGEQRAAAEQQAMQAQQTAAAAAGLTPDVVAAQQRHPGFTQPEAPNAEPAAAVTPVAPVAPGQTEAAATAPAGAAAAAQDATQGAADVGVAGRGGGGPNEPPAAGAAAGQGTAAAPKVGAEILTPRYGKTTTRIVVPGQAAPQRTGPRPRNEAVMRSAAEIVNKIRSAFPGGKSVPVRLVWDPATEIDPSIRDDPEGMYSRESGEVVLNVGRLSNWATADEARRRIAEVTLHELVGHHGVESVLTPQEIPGLVAGVKEAFATPGGVAGMESRVDAAGKSQLDRKGNVKIGAPDYVTWEGVKRSYPNESDVMVAVELVARAAEMGMKNTLVKQVVSTVRAALRRILQPLGIEMKWTDADVLDLVRRGSQRLRSPREGSLVDLRRRTSVLRALKECVSG